MITVKQKNFHFEFDGTKDVEVVDSIVTLKFETVTKLYNHIYNTLRDIDLKESNGLWVRKSLDKVSSHIVSQLAGYKFFVGDSIFWTLVSFEKNDYESLFSSLDFLNENNYYGVSI
tara:strand:+ start:78 stop:425 length:348 start_codon:yes stop_codon:yes gene_type:complete